MIRPPGTPGLPAPQSRRLKTSLKLDRDNSDLPKLFISALTALLEEMKRTGAGKKRWNLGEGVRVRAGRGGAAYKFETPLDITFPDDANIELHVGNAYLNAAIVCVNAETLLLEVEEDLGPVIPRVVILIQTNGLLQKLVEKIKAVDTGGIRLNRDQKYT
jgi:hypothetical protein